jgi:hypothetical protein
MAIIKPTTGSTGWDTNLNQVIDAINGDAGRTEITTQISAAINAASGATVCTSSTRPTPHEGSVIAETDSGLVFVYVSGAWRPLYSLGMVTKAFESNQGGTGQSIPNATDTTISFDIDNYVTSYATKSTSGPGHMWTVNRSGMWGISSTMRWDSAATGSIRFLSIRKLGSQMVSTNQHLSHTNVAQQNAAIIMPINAGETFDVAVWQDSGTAKTLDPNNSLGWCRVNAVWLGL